MAQIEAISMGKYLIGTKDPQWRTKRYKKIGQFIGKNQNYV